MDFNSLVNEILRMAKDSADERKKRAEGSSNISWDNTPAGEAYWKDIRARNSMKELTGQTQLTEQANIGKMARERISGNSDTDVFGALRKDGDIKVPSPGDKSAAVLAGMNNEEFKNAANDPNFTQPTGGFGYIEGANKNGVKFQRVLGDTVSGGETSLPGAKKEPPPISNKATEITPEVKTAQEGFEKKYSWWDRYVASTGAAANAEAGLVEPSAIPEQPIDIVTRRKKVLESAEAEEKKRKSQEFYEKWLQSNK